MHPSVRAVVQAIAAFSVFGGLEASAPAAVNGVPPTIFADEFSVGRLDPSLWTAINRADAEDGEEYYTPDNATVTNGSLNLLTKVDGTFRCCLHTSAEVQWRSASFTYGTVEIRAQLAGGLGTWPAIWLLGQDCQVSNLTTPANIGLCAWPFPGSDEIDIAELLGSDHTTVNQQIHSNGHEDGCRPRTVDVSAGFHVYQLNWRPGSLAWLIDGVPTCHDAADPALAWGGRVDDSEKCLARELADSLTRSGSAPAKQESAATRHRP